MKQAIAIAGIHTGIGKTVVSAVLAEAWQADYWKPVQAGELDNTDSMKVQGWISNGMGKIHPEAFRLTNSLSPHEAAAIDGVEINKEKLVLPKTDNVLLVETAGGLMSPVGIDFTVADMIAFWNIPVILVTQHYLGSINHTLLCLEVLQKRGLNTLGLVINGAKNAASEKFICDYSGINILAEIPWVENTNRATVSMLAKEINWNPENKIRHGNA